MLEQDLPALREKIAEVDEQILGLVAKRLQIAEEIGKYKLENGITIKAFDVEKKVTQRYQKIAKALNIDTELTNSLSTLLIDHACKVQERKRLDKITSSYKASKSPGKAVVIGGAGNMGVWFYNFLNSFGYECFVIDTNKKSHDLIYVDENVDYKSFMCEVDIIVVATPLAITNEVLKSVAATETKALVFDIASLKSPILETLNLVKTKLPNLVSVHPMFGPSVDLLTGENILVCDMGNEKANNLAISLFEKTAATVSLITPESHDELMSEVLGLSHIINLLFADVLNDTKVPISYIIDSKSTTFKSQLDVSMKVASENPALYYDIQQMNVFTPELYQRLRKSVDRLTSLVLLDNKEDFTNLMKSYGKTLNALKSH